MLRNVLEDYLERVQERDFDLPFMALLPALGFFDVHYTHGQTEFGKDFIAKKQEGEITVQYSFQSKAGDINQSEWRSIQDQMLEALLTTLSHPNFDSELAHQTVLVTTGRLIGNAALSLQDLNKKIISTYKRHPIHLWDKLQLITFLEKYGGEEIYRATSASIESYGNFFMLYGKALRGAITESEIENQSRHWLWQEIPYKQCILGSALEAEIIASKCIENGNLYEAIQAYRALVRNVMFTINSLDSQDRTSDDLSHLYRKAIDKVSEVSYNYITQIQELWVSKDLDFVKLVNGPSSMISYLVNLARSLEVAGYIYFGTSQKSLKNMVITFINQMVKAESGSGHIPSDHYAVSLVLPILALIDNKDYQTAYDFIGHSAKWLCDRYQDGLGLASYDSKPYDEVVQLLGYPFDFFPITQKKDSFSATVLADLAAFLGDKKLFGDVVNDFQACNIFPTYWQIPDTTDIFIIEGDGIISYPNVEFQDDLDDFHNFKYAQHIAHEPKTFHQLDIFGAIGFMILMLLLRDRYFPTIWPYLVRDGPVKN